MRTTAIIIFAVWALALSSKAQDATSQQLVALRAQMGRIDKSLMLAVSNQSADELIAAEQALKEYEQLSKHNHSETERIEWRRLLLRAHFKRLYIAQTTDVSLSDPNEMPTLNVAPRGGPSGVSPDVIKDPQARAEYEKAIEENKRKAQRARYLMALKHHREIWQRTLDYLISRHYANAPQTLAEVGEILGEFEASDQWRHNEKARIAKLLTLN